MIEMANKLIIWTKGEEEMGLSALDSKKVLENWTQK